MVGGELVGCILIRQLSLCWPWMERSGLLSVKAAVCSNAGGLRAGLVQGAEQRKEGRAQGWLWGAVVSTMRTRTPLGSLTCGWSVCR